MSNLNNVGPHQESAASDYTGNRADTTNAGAPNLSRDLLTPGCAERTNSTRTTFHATTSGPCPTTETTAAGTEPTPGTANTNTPNNTSAQERCVDSTPAGRFTLNATT
jgi:hypothetical protein